MEGRMGVAPGEEMEMAKIEMQAALQKLTEEDEWFVDHPVELEWYGARWVPGEVAMDHPLLARLQELYPSVFGEAAIIEASPWGTDGGLLTKLADTPSIIIGPGVTQVAHYPDEYIVLDDIFACAELFALTLIEWCELAD